MRLKIVCQPAQEMGRTAVNLLCKRGESPQTGARIVLPVEIVLRRSCGCQHHTRFGNCVAARDGECTNLRDSGKSVDGPGQMYRAEAFSHGLTMPDTGADGKIETRFRAIPLAVFPSTDAPAIPALPAPDTWANLDFVGGQLYYGTKMADLLRGFASATPCQDSVFTYPTNRRRRPIQRRSMRRNIERSEALCRTRRRKCRHRCSRQCVYCRGTDLCL